LNLIDWVCDFVPCTHASTVIYESGLIYLIVGPFSKLIGWVKGLPLPFPCAELVMEDFLSSTFVLLLVTWWCWGFKKFLTQLVKDMVITAQKVCGPGVNFNAQTSTSARVLALIFV
jgi:hypothetical protein